MIQIHFADRNSFISDAEFQKLSILLPYWGLMVDDDRKIKGRSFSRTIGISGLSKKLLSDLNKYLFHTGFDVSPSANNDFNVFLDYDSTTPIAIRVQSVTYKLNPSSPSEGLQLEDHIFKKVWLPMCVAPVHVLINPDFSSQVAEWVSYLIIQYAIAPEEFLHLSSFSIEEYQTYLQNYLFYINPDFARLQSLDNLIHDSWPTFPGEAASLTPTSKESLFERAWDIEDSEVELEDENVEELVDEKYEEYDKAFDNDSHGFPFLSRPAPSEPTPINPFKKKNQEQQSVIDPFRKS